MAARVVFKLTPIVTDLGECPMCGFDSLRQIRVYHLTSGGVTMLAEQTGCGRCLNDLRGGL
jgi:hypothetical protein